MANSRSARKQIRASERKRIRNRTVRTSVRTEVNQARKALLQDAGGVDVEQDVMAAVRALDRAAEKGIIHRNNAARRKSRLTSMAVRLIRAATGDNAAAVRTAAAGGEKGRAAAAKRGGAKGSAKVKAAAKTAAKSAPRSSAARTAAARSASGKGAAGATKAAAGSTKTRATSPKSAAKTSGSGAAKAPAKGTTEA